MAKNVWQTLFIRNFENLTMAITPKNFTTSICQSSSGSPAKIKILTQLSVSKITLSSVDWKKIRRKKFVNFLSWLSIDEIHVNNLIKIFHPDVDSNRIVQNIFANLAHTPALSVFIKFVS